MLIKIMMNGYETKYLHYVSGKSEVTLPRMILEAFSLNWNHKDALVLIPENIEDKKGLFLSKEGQGHITRYIYYERTKKSSVTIPKILLEANNLNWKHGDILILVLKEIEAKKGIFLYKKEK